MASTEVCICFQVSVKTMYTKRQSHSRQRIGVQFLVVLEPEEVALCVFWSLQKQLLFSWSLLWNDHHWVQRNQSQTCCDKRGKLVYKPEDTYISCRMIQICRKKWPTTHRRTRSTRTARQHHLLNHPHNPPPLPWLQPLVLFFCPGIRKNNFHQFEVVSDKDQARGRWDFSGFE